MSNLQIEEDHVQALMTVLDRSAGADGWTSLIDLGPLFYRLTLDSATEFLFGKSVNSQLEAGSEAVGPGNETELSQSIDAAMLTTAKGFRLGRHYWIMFTKQFYRHVKVIHNYVDHFVGRALSMDEKAEAEQYNYLQALVKETRDPAVLQGEILSLLFAGRDTTASSISWFFHVMARHPETYQKLRAVILDEFGTYAAPQNITYESMKACRYLQWCINETLRVHTVAPFMSRAATRDTTLPTGGGPDGKSPIYIKKGQPVNLTVCHSPQLLL